MRKINFCFAITTCDIVDADSIVRTIYAFLKTKYNVKFIEEHSKMLFWVL